MGRALDPIAGRSRTLDRVLLVGVVLLYAVLAARRLDVPNPAFDEASYVPPALDVLRAAAAGHPRDLPLMVMTYVGCPMSYLIAPFVAVWGIGVAALRLPAIGVALTSVLVLLYLASKIFPRLPLWAPAAACLLNGTFLISSRTGLYCDAAIHWLLLSLLLLCLWTWSRTRRPLAVFSVFFLAGFGIYSKIIFVWFWFAAGLVVWGLSRRDGRTARAKLAGLCALGSFSGALPLLIYNATSGWPTASEILGNLIRPSDPAEASNLSIARNLVTRGDQLFRLFTGAYQYRFGPSASLAGACLLALFVAAFFLFPERTQRAAVAVSGLFVAAFLLGSMFTISERIPEHLYPILPLMLVLGGVSLARLCGGRSPLLLACLALLSTAQVRSFNAYLDGCASAADARALSSLGAYLTAAGISRPVALDWGLTFPLLVMSGGKVEPRGDNHAKIESLKPGGTAICVWKPEAPDPARRGCARLLGDASFALGQVREFPGAPDPPVYASIRVLGVR